MDRSIRRLGAFLIALFCALFAQLNYIQVFHANSLNTKPDNTRQVDLTFSRERGTIVTSDGVVLARSVPSEDRWEFQRQYPEKDLYAHITGYFNYSFGATGLERAYNDELSGTTARQQVRSIGDLFAGRNRTGNLELTVRSDVQAAAKAALGTQRGSVVALDPRTGGVLALWSYPSYDPNALSSHDFPATEATKALLEQDPAKPLLAKSYREIYPPGSTFKVVTGSTGLEDGSVTETSPRYPYLSSLDLPQTDRNLRNFGGEVCGGALFDILATSCNTSFAQMGLDLGGDKMIAGAQSFGFDSVPPLDLPAVASSFPPGPFVRDQPSLAYASIGQGQTAATPLQMALVAAGVANDGVIMRPHVVGQVVDSDGQTMDTIEPEPWKRAVSAKTAETMRRAMMEVVARGTATRLQIPGLDVGAKTGTAQYGPAEPLRSHAWIIAWAGPPGQTPTIAVAVLVEGQDTLSEQTGGRVAAPIAKAVIEQAMQPPPTHGGTGGAGGTTTTTVAGNPAPTGN